MNKNVTTTDKFDVLYADHGYVLDVLKRVAEEDLNIYAVVHNVARSGMSRTMSIYVNVDGRMISLNNLIVALGIGRARKYGFNISGCGMDMGFHVIYTLGEMLFGYGYTLNSPTYL